MKVLFNGKDFIILPDNSEAGMYVDAKHKRLLDRIKALNKKNWDCIAIYDGKEGAGKSTKAIQDAYYLDPLLNLDRICFNSTDFMNACKSASIGQAVVYDEAYTGLYSRASMSKVNRTIVKMLAEIRQKRLYIMIVMPTFFDLDRNIALWRTRYLVHVYTGKDMERGRFSYYNGQKKINLYNEGKKLYRYNFFKGYLRPLYKGKFTKFFPLSFEEYSKKKYEALVNREEEEDDEFRFKVALKALNELVLLKDIPIRLKKWGLKLDRSTLGRYLIDFDKRYGGLKGEGFK